MIRENQDVYQTATVDTDQELKQAVLVFLEAFKAEVRETANGRKFRVRGKARTDPDGTRYAHLRMQYTEDELEDTDVTKVSTTTIDEYTIGVYDSPVLEA